MFPSLKSNADTPSDQHQPFSFAGSRHSTTNQSCVSSWWPLGSKDSISDGSGVNQVSRPGMGGGRQGDLECSGMSWSLPSAAWSHPSSCDIYCSDCMFQIPSFGILEHQEPLEINPGLSDTHGRGVTPQLVTLAQGSRNSQRGEREGHRAALEPLRV